MNFADPLYKVLVRKKGDVADLITQSRQRQHLTRLLQSALDPALAPHAWVARLEPPVLVIVVDTPARAGRLRYLGPGLARKLSQKHKEFQSITKIELCIAPARLQPRKPELVARHLGPEAVSSLTAMANSLEDVPLKTALLRLASRAKSNEGRSD